ncbi:MAG: GAF domain-containing sensor histidine kinase [Candidatus Eisenbacteria bacterium]|nr:GAF domain-containing sensor histidine kinase [Candidatus Eisenbacteria bacterium]
MFLWMAVTALFVAAIVAFGVALRCRAERRRLCEEMVRIEEGQARILRGLILAEESATRILTPGQLTGTVERIAQEACSLLEVEGICIFVRPPEGEGEPAGICSGRIPVGMEEASRPVKDPAGEGFGSILSIPIRLDDQLLGEFRVAESPSRSLNLRELHVVRLLAQLVAIAAQYRIQRHALEQAEEDKRRFILATTHDLRAPVSTIEQLAQVMREGYAGAVPEKPRELIEKIHGRATHLLELLSDLLDLAVEDQEPGKMREPIPVSLAAVFDKQVEAARAGCEAKGIDIRACRPEGSFMRMAAQGDLENLIGNLLSNAVKYTPRGGRIQVTLSDSPGGIVFRVQDTGIGIPKEAMPHLFTQYFRASNARLVEKHGTGLGLALVQKLVRKYEGRLRIESTEGKGTQVEVLLPHA